MGPREIDYSEDGPDIIIPGHHDDPKPEMGNPQDQPEIGRRKIVPEMGEENETPGHDSPEMPLPISPDIQEVEITPNPQPKNPTREEIEKIIGEVTNDPKEQKRIIDELIRRQEEEQRKKDKEKPTLN